MPVERGCCAVPVSKESAGEAQHRSTLVVAHLFWVARIVLGHVHGTHPTIQRRLLLLKLLEYLIHAETSTIVSLAMDDGKEVGDGEDDVVGCGELDLVVFS